MMSAADTGGLAVTTATRLPGMPDLPSVAETVPGFTAIGWSLLAAPAGTPEAVTGEVDRTVKAVLADPRVKSRLTDLNVYPSPMSAAELRQFISAEQSKWWPRVKAHAAALAAGK